MFTSYLGTLINLQLRNQLTAHGLTILGCVFVDAVTGDIVNEDGQDFSFVRDRPLSCVHCLYAVYLTAGRSFVLDLSNFTTSHTERGREAMGQRLRRALEHECCASLLFIFNM